MKKHMHMKLSQNCFFITNINLCVIITFLDLFNYMYVNTNIYVNIIYFIISISFYRYICTNHYVQLKFLVNF